MHAHSCDSVCLCLRLRQCVTLGTGHLITCIRRLNTVMTVRQGQANSHKGKGWETFTDAAISQLCQRRKGIVFLLWGKPAQAKEKFIPATRHHVLKCPHPSPLASASGPGFSGCRHFSQANALLEKSGMPPIDWEIE